jgi:LCP family protein required for cell wall assembly
VSGVRVRRWARLTAILGILTAILGLTGFWLSRDVQRTVLTAEERQLVNPGSDAFQVSFVLAGRDYDYDEPAGPLVMRNGKAVRSFVTEARLGFRTDTIMYVNIVGNRVFMVSIPRDIMLNVPGSNGTPARRIGINQVYEYPALYGGPDRADNLRRAVSALLDLPIDYYAVINIDIFERLVDAVGGVKLEVPERMVYSDQAGGLEIDLQPGFQHLTGEQAAGFVRYREFLRGDIDRIDNIKTLAYAMLSRLQELNLRAIGTVPELVETYLDEVDTNISPALLSQLALRLGALELEAVTLPTQDVPGSGRFVRAVPAEVEGFLAGLFGGEARPLTETPETTVMLSNRSGLPGLAAAVKRQLVAMGLPAARLRVRQGGNDAVTRVVTTNAGLSAAPFYADLFGVGWQQVDRLALDEDIEIVLGRDARGFHGAAQFAQGGQP